MIYGKADKGKVVHIAQEIPQLPDGPHFIARCDKKMRVVTDENLDIQTVTCSKCKRYADYKAAMADVKPDDPKPPVKAKKSIAKKKAPAKKAAPKKKAPSKKKPAAKTLTAEEKLAAMEKKLADEKEKTRKLELDLQEARRPADLLPDKPEDKRNLTEENYKDFMKKGVQPETVEVGDNHFKDEKSQDGSYRVIHIPSGKAVMTGVEKVVINTVLKYLNNMKIKWEKVSDPVPKEFLPACATAIRAAYASHGKKIKVGVEGQRAIKRRKKPVPAEKPTGRKIKRRKKAGEPASTEPRKIKRRKQKTVNEYGFRINSVRGVMSEMVARGSRFEEIKREAKRIDKSLTEKQVKGKLAAVIRKLVNSGYTVVIIKVKVRDLCVYHIAEDTEK